MKSMLLYSTFLVSLLTACSDTATRTKTNASSSPSTNTNTPHDETQNRASESSGESASQATTQSGCYIRNNENSSERCFDYSNTRARIDLLQRTCQQDGGRFLPDGCPSQRQVGRCRLPHSDLGTAEVIFYAPSMDLQQAEQTCSYIGGSFVK